MFKSLLTEWHEIGWTDIPASAKSEKDSTYPIEAMHFKIKWDNTYEVPNMMPGTQICLTKIVNMGLPGSPVVKIPWALGSKFLVKKLRSHMLHGVAKKKKNGYTIMVAIELLADIHIRSKEGHTLWYECFCFLCLDLFVTYVCGRPFPTGVRKRMVDERRPGWVGLRWMLVVEG